MTEPDTEALIDCIYCGQRKAPSREHVLQRSLGGDFTWPVACKDCNTDLSSIDQSLAERSLWSLHRVGFAKPGGMPTKLGGDHFHFDAPRKLWQEVEVVNGMEARVLPQLHLRDGVGFEFASRDAEGRVALTDFLESLQKKGKLAKTFIKVDDSEKVTTTRLVMHRSNDCFVRARSEEDGRRFLDLLEENLAALVTYLRSAEAGAAPTETATKPEISVSVTIRLDDNYRAIEKIAFNFLAHRLGNEFALKAEFNELRDYITGRKIVHSDVDTDQILYDKRFVRWLSEEKAPLVPTKDHGVALWYEAPTLYGLVTLYGENSFVVRLGDVVVDTDVTAAHGFSTDRTGNAPISADKLRLHLWKQALEGLPR